MSTPTWKRILSEDGSAVYEGFTLLDKPYGPGIVYYPSGEKYQEGVFGIKGMLLGREYYPDSTIRFEGTLRINRGYGPNIPVYGKCFREDGMKYFDGKLKVHLSGLGYPIVENPKEYGPVMSNNKPVLHYFMWDDAQSLGMDC